MAKMNVTPARGGDDDFGAVGEEPTMPARYAGTCRTCGQRFAVGDPIASVLVDKKMTYHHAACRYRASALLADGAAVATSSRGPSIASAPVTCQATTSKGKPCSNKPQKGERFCGPHLTQQVNRSADRRSLPAP